MKKLDLYILKRYLKTVLFVTLGLVMVICLIDFTEKNDDFIKHQAPMGKILSEYYLNLIPDLAVFISPIFAFLGTLIVNSVMTAHTEVIAILSSGISFGRFLMSYMIGAIILALSIFLLVGWVIPNGNKHRVAFEMEYMIDMKNDRKNMHVMITPDVKAYVMYFDTQNNTGKKFTLEEFRGVELIEKIKANRIQWDTLNKKWQLRDCSIRSYHQGKETLKFVNQIDTALALLPKDFEVTYKKVQTLTIPELRQYIEDLELKGTENVESYLIDYYEKFTYPFAVIILTMIAVIVSSRKTREGVALQIIIGVVLAFAYWGILQTGRIFAMDQSIHPLVSSWAPNIVFSIIGLFMYFKVPK